MILWLLSHKIIASGLKSRADIHEYTVQKGDTVCVLLKKA